MPATRYLDRPAVCGDKPSTSSLMGCVPHVLVLGSDFRFADADYHTFQPQASVSVGSRPAKFQTSSLPSVVDGGRCSSYGVSSNVLSEETHPVSSLPCESVGCQECHAAVVVLRR